VYAATEAQRCAATKVKAAGKATQCLRAVAAKVAAGSTIDDARTAARILMRVNSPDAIEQGENAPWVAAPRARAVAKPETRNSFPTAGRQSSGLQPLMQAVLCFEQDASVLRSG